MRGVVYCSVCGASNNEGLKSCMTCGSPLEVRKNPITTAEFANRKMAVFDLDMTLLDNRQRFTDAVRAGIVNKDGSPKHKGSWKKRGEFLYQPNRLAKDKLMPNAMNLIEHLMEDGYTIAYCTARPIMYYEVTKDQLEDKGLPLFQDATGSDLLFCKRSVGQKTPLYKADVVRKLQAQYDVRLFFDDKLENLSAALKVGVPGVYSSVAEYYDMVKGVRNNGGHNIGMHKGQQFVMHDHPDVAGRMMIDPDDPEGRTVAETSNVDPFTGKPKNPGGMMYSEMDLERALESIKGTKIQTNPGPMGEMCIGCVYVCGMSGKCKKWTEMKGSPVYVASDWYCKAYKPRAKSNPIKRGRDGKGPYMRWGDKGKKYHYKAGSKSSREKARKKAHMQASAAFAGGYRGKYNPGHAMKVKDILIDEGGASGLKPLMKAFPKGTSEKKAREMLKTVPDVYLHPAGDYILMNPAYREMVLQNPEEYSEDYMVPRDIDKLGKAADSMEATYHEGIEVPEWWKSKLSVTADKADNLSDALGYVADNPSHVLKIYSGEPKSKFVNKGAIFAEVQIGRNVGADVGEVVQSIYRGLVGGRTSLAERRMAMAIASMQKELSDRAEAVGGNAIANLRVDYEIVQGTATLTILAHADAIKMPRKPKSNPPRSNPPKSKVEKGKQLYRHMNGKEPAKTETKVIDIGDVWYQVGEGGCWSIGYMSGKETGSSNQKYVHNFNEETKNGDFPKLYATIPDKGKPMLIITGGTWKIKTDEDGVAWIYD